MRNGGLGHVEVAIEIGFDRAVEMLLGQLFETVDVLLERGVVHEDVELAQFVDGPLDGVFAEFRIGHVARDEDAAAALFLDGAFRLLGIFMLVEIGDGDIGALPRVEHGDRASNPRVAAGDKRNHSFELA